jgi:membrane peptidoglycan carboxypeptidase
MLVTPTHVAAMTDMLRAVLTSGTAKRAALPNHPAAGKTGTSQDFRDAWFVGYSGQFIAGVWLGNDDGSPMNKVMGGSLPARLWHDAMLAALSAQNRNVPFGHQVEMSPGAVEGGVDLALPQGLWSGRALNSPSRPQARAVGHEGWPAR